MQKYFFCQLKDEELSYLNKLLPIGYSLQPCIREQKRSRICKKVQHIDTNNLSKYHKQSQMYNIKVTHKKTNHHNYYSFHQKNNQKQKEQPIKTNSKMIENCNISNTSNCLQVCQTILHKLKNHKSSWPFRLPVDPISQEVPNYLEIIRQPMDLKTIEKKLKGNFYQHESQFHADINKIFLNSYKFNPKDTIYYLHTLQFENYYQNILEKSEQNPHELINKKIHVQPRIEQQFQANFDSYKNINDPYKNKKIKKNISCNENKILNKILLNYKNIPPIKQHIYQQQNYRMSVIDRQKMFNKMRTVPSEILQKIVQTTYKQQHTNPYINKFQIDIEKMTQDKYQNIKKIMDNFQNNGQKFYIQ